MGGQQRVVLARAEGAMLSRIATTGRRKHAATIDRRAYPKLAAAPKLPARAAEAARLGAEAARLVFFVTAIRRILQ